MIPSVNCVKVTLNGILGAVISGCGIAFPPFLDAGRSLDTALLKMSPPSCYVATTHVNSRFGELKTARTGCGAHKKSQKPATST